MQNWKWPSPSLHLPALALSLGCMLCLPGVQADLIERLESEKLWGVYQIHGYPPRFRDALLKQIDDLESAPD